MSRERFRSNKFLPKYVTRQIDRHGRERYRFRRQGCPSYCFKAAIGTETFRTEYAFCIAGKQRQSVIDPSMAQGSVADLYHRYSSSLERLGPTEVTQRKVRATLEIGIVNQFGHLLVCDMTFEHVDQLIARRRKVSVQNGRKTGGIEAARKFRKEMLRLLAFAEKIGMTTLNAARHSDKVRVAAGQRSTGYHSWTEEEIDRYRARHKLGDKARLALELLLWTGQRRSDVVHLGPSDIRNSAVFIRQKKGGKTLQIKVARQLLRAIAAMPANDTEHFLLTEWGKPFSKAGFGNWFRLQCDAAGLPQCTAHGLRKAAMRRMAELDMGNSSLKAVSGHTKDNEVALYTAAADQRQLAENAVTALEDWEDFKTKSMSNLAEKFDIESV